MDHETASLIQMLHCTRRQQVREMLVRQLAERADPDAAPTLISLLEVVPESRAVPLVGAAVAGLQKMGQSIAPLVLQLLDDTAQPNRAFMPLLLVSALGADAGPRLIQALDDFQADVQINAAAQLGQLRYAGAFDPLLAIVEDANRDPEFRGVATAALGALRDRRALTVLASLSTTLDPELLNGAIDGLADLRDPEGIPYLEAILNRDDIDERTTRAVRLALLAMERYRDR